MADEQAGFYMASILLTLVVITLCKRERGEHGLS
jgi:hypothetical protein